MSAPITIDCVVLDGNPPSAVPTIIGLESKCVEPDNAPSNYAIIPVSRTAYVSDGSVSGNGVPNPQQIYSRCIERENVVTSYAIIPSTATSTVVDSATQKQAKIEWVSKTVSAYSLGPVTYSTSFPDVVILAESVLESSSTPSVLSEAVSLTTQTAIYPTRSDQAVLEVLDGPGSYVFRAKLDNIFVVSVSVGTTNVEKTAEPGRFVSVSEPFIPVGYFDDLFNQSNPPVFVSASATGSSGVEKTNEPTRFSSLCEPYFSPDDTVLPTRLEPIYAMAPATGINTREPLKPKTIEAYSGSDPSDSVGGGGSGFFWG